MTGTPAPVTIKVEDLTGEEPPLCQHRRCRLKHGYIENAEDGEKFLIHRRISLIDSACELDQTRGASMWRQCSSVQHQIISFYGGILWAHQS
jgi:hypothetical protein